MIDHDNLEDFRDAQLYDLQDEGYYDDYHLRLVKPPALAVGIQEAFLLWVVGMGPRRRRAASTAQHTEVPSA